MNPVSIVLAAGKGTRMRSETMPKVMYPIAGYPMIGWVIEAVSPFGAPHLVVGYLREQVEEFVRQRYPEARFSYQKEQNGTGGAVRCALAEAMPGTDCFLIAPGDAPLLKKETLERLIRTFEQEKAGLALVTCMLDEPSSYGRVKREGGLITGIVEYNDATTEERAIREVNSGIYFVSRKVLEEALPHLTNTNAKKEYYLTDIVSYVASRGVLVTSIVEEDSASLTGVNSPEELANAEKIMQLRLRAALEEAEVHLISPDTIYIEHDVIVGRGTVIHPYVRLRAGSRIGENCIIGPHVEIEGVVPDRTVVNRQ